MRAPNLGSTQYTPGPVPVSAADLQRYIGEELQQIAAAINSLAAGHVDETTVQPTKPRNGDIRLFGTTWNPGAGAGFYGYSAGAWVLLG